MKKKILVLGGDGVLGQHISRVIAAMPSAQCVVGGRRTDDEAPPVGEKITRIVVNANEPASLRRVLQGMFAVVNTVGPFQGRDYAVAETCASMGIHYVDTADARAFIDGIARLGRRAQQKDCLIISGAGMAPAVSTVLADMLAPEFDDVREINVSVSWGNKNPIGVASLRSLLTCAGAPLRFKEKGSWRYADGWSESEVVRFPEPLGKRRVYLCDAPDLDILPARYGVPTVTYRAGFELGLFNRGLSLLGRMRHWGWIKNLADRAPALSAASRLFRRFGSEPSGMQLRMRGYLNGQEIERTASVIARDNNFTAIACSPALALIRKWVGKGHSEAGAAPCVDLLTWDEIRAELAGYDILLVRT